MNGISLDNMLALQQLSTGNGISSSSAAGSQAFASLLEEQLNESKVSSSDTNNSADIEKKLLITLCLSMFGGSPAIDSLCAALVGNVNSISAENADNPAGNSIVNSAMSRLGDPYSGALRGTGNYVDCSYLAQWAYKQSGISIPGTAAAQAKYCYENGYTVSKEELKPGDLIFWENTQTGTRWRHIHHVAIYAGDGKIVEAKGPEKGVESGDIWETGKWKIAMYARPRASAETAST